MAGFRDFWSTNRWFCQYFFEEDAITEVIIVAPMDEAPYHVSDRFQGRTVTDFEQWLLELDQNTLTICTLPIQGIPALELRVFPCADGYFYVAYPPSPPDRPGQIYSEILWSFDRDVHLVATKELANMQQLVSDAGRRIWLQLAKILCS